MRTLSNEMELVARRLLVIRQPRLFRRFQEEEAIQLVDRLGSSGEAVALSTVVDCLTVRNTKVRAAARSAIVRLMAGLTTCQLLEVKNWIGWRWRWASPAGWHKAEPADVMKLAGTRNEPGHFEILGLLSFHSNGFVRQEAVRRLAKVQDGSEIPFLLLRQNDWVQIVRSEAEVALSSRITDDRLPQFLQSMELVLHLPQCRRQDHGPTVRRILNLLLETRNDALLRQAVSHSVRAVRRAVVRYGLQTPGEHRVRVIENGLQSNDGVLRLHCLRHLPELYDGRELLERLQQSNGDPFQPVRLASVRLIVGHFPKLAEATWRCALCDPGRAVRELAQFTLRKSGSCDIASFYREQTDEAGRNLPAVEGLAECGDGTDAEFFRSLLWHPYARRRAAAVRGLSRVAAESVREDLVPLLRDGSARVLRTVRQALQPVCRMIPESLLEEIATEGTSRAARRNAVLLLADRGRWICLPPLLRVAACDTRETARFAAHCIARWFSPAKCRSLFIRPTEEDRERISAGVAAAHGYVPSGLLNHILQTMKYLA